MISSLTNFQPYFLLSKNIGKSTKLLTQQILDQIENDVNEI